MRGNLLEGFLSLYGYLTYKDRILDLVVRSYATH